MQDFFFMGGGGVLHSLDNNTSPLNKINHSQIYTSGLRLLITKHILILFNVLTEILLFISYALYKESYSHQTLFVLLHFIVTLVKFCFVCISIGNIQLNSHSIYKTNDDSCAV